MTPVPQEYELQHNMTVFSLRQCICSGFKESKDETNEEEGVKVTAQSPSNKHTYSIGPCVCGHVYTATDNVIQ